MPVATHVSTLALGDARVNDCIYMWITRNLSSYRFKVNLAWPGGTLKVSLLRSVFEQKKPEKGLFMGPQAAFCRH